MYSIQPREIPGARPAIPARPTRLLDQLRRRHMRGGSYVWKTGQTHVRWITRFIRFYGKRHLATLSKAHAKQYLNLPASERQYSPATEIVTHVLGRGSMGVVSPLDSP